VYLLFLELSMALQKTKVRLPRAYVTLVDVGYPL